MNKILFACFFTRLIFFLPASQAQQKPLFNAGEQPRLISGQFSFTEGPSVDKVGNIYFTDQPNNRIWKYGTDGKLSVFMESAGRANGTYFDKNGNLIVCADEHNQLWRITPKGKTKILLNNYSGRLLNGPNDLWVSPHGDIYFTDPYYQREYWLRTKSEQSGQMIFVLLKGKKEAIFLDSLVKPNGIVGSPDGKTLFIADIGAGKIYKYPILKPGRLGTRKLFYKQGADGITLDEYGNLYLAGNGITVIDPNGKKTAHIDIPEPWTANLCFGGKNRDELFITASKAIYVLKMNVRGVE
ncbi:SMP-30/gluconolactonase/LRE family protein [Mucilaginibacter sp. 44-25]|uniref:SMP-30/gluconolactonase/LRE family protein n=1 Tax=Mucilaginibacter sp. 44-25 TaxID=1895794 RepID=UPI00095C941E|nr:SMP-30/gluconolactonase/LRE family protein [Mucilaginibacter sp. 44-25]OJW18291.1 MAG: gluconolactonase [Mucilaginibacter sp. 44-25]